MLLGWFGSLGSNSKDLVVDGLMGDFLQTLTLFERKKPLDLGQTSQYLCHWMRRRRLSLQDTNLHFFLSQTGE